MKITNCMAMGLIFCGAQALAADQFRDIRTTVLKIQPAAQIQKIEKSPLPGLYVVHAKDFDPIYMTLDGKTFIVGTMLQVGSDGKVVEVGAEGRNADRAAALMKVPVGDMIVFKPKSGTKALVYVFTDVDCGYCRQLHSHMQDYLNAGIEVRYLAFPRGGIESETFGSMEAIWCSKDRAGALTRAKAGAEIEATTCSNPVASQLRLGKQLGVQGTPAIYTADGRQIGGYLPTEAIKKALGI